MTRLPTEFSVGVTIVYKSKLSAYLVGEFMVSITGEKILGVWSTIWGSPSHNNLQWF
jgi:hypothetical protein